MRAFNKDDYELVKAYEGDFRRAIDSRYAKNITLVQFYTINKVYRETLNRSANSNCGGCVLQMLTSVGRLYFSFKEKFEAEEAAKKRNRSQRSQNRGRRTSNKNKEENKDVHKDKIETQGSEGNPGDEPNN